MFAMLGSIPYCSVAVFGTVLSVLSLFGSAEPPDHAVGEFVKLFSEGNAEGVKGLFHQDIVQGKDLQTDEVSEFLARFKARQTQFKGFKITRRLKSEDGETERFQATLTFDGPVSFPHYPGRPALEMSFQWVMEKKKWWLERPLSIRYLVSSNQAYPTPEQTEAAAEFQAAVEVLDKLNRETPDQDVPFIGKTTQGSAVTTYKELEKLYNEERTPKGVDPDGRGVALFLKGAAMEKCDVLLHYHGDFKVGPSDERRPVPWDMFRDYAEAAVRHGKKIERRGSHDKAEVIYRRLINLGRQFLAEPGGFRFVTWGTAFQQIGARELERLFLIKGDPSIDRLKGFAGLCARRMDLLNTAISCLDDMNNFKALNAAIIASSRKGDPVFRPWALNTLAILALKGALADEQTLQAAGAPVFVVNPAMQTTADNEVNRLTEGSSRADRAFIEMQKKWVASHVVYKEAAP